LIVIRRLLPLGAIGFMSVALLGCDVASRDAWNDPGTWQSTGANNVNLQSMIANPNDLVAGRGERGGSAIIAATAVNRVLTDKIKALPTSLTYTVGASSTAAASGGQVSAPQ
jgi:hypothetical protein